MDDTADSDDRFDSLLAAVARIPVQSWTPPAEHDEYRLLRPLGTGGMGSVWLAEDRLLDRLVAIKFIAHAEPDRHTRDRFAIEARAAARLSHVNVVTVYRFGEIADRPYLVSEYIRGESLDQLAKPVAWMRALDLGTALARGLAAAHRHGIVHRDIKPANAILAGDGQVKLVDFGLAKLGSSDEPAASRATPVDPLLTAPGTIAGTPLYLAPEVRAGGPADRRSDVYQVGCILYELVTGRAPLLDAGESGAVLSIAPRVGEDGARFAAVVDRCTQRDPELRFASGDELREALERLAAPFAGGELPEGNPYRGLLAFDAEHRGLFFGRGAEIRAVIDRLRTDPFVLVTGDSGVGKSSLCRAGVVPHVGEGAFDDGLAWTSVSLVPGQRPIATLASALAPTLGSDEAELASMLRDAPRDVPRALRRALGNDRCLLVFVDQLEELVTLADRADAAAAGAVLRELAAGVPGVRLLATVRGDFFARVGELPGIGDELGRAVYLLRSLTPEGAREAVVGPARVKGGTLEPALVDTLVASIADKHAIELPLLAFTLAQLWDARDQGTQAITARSLEAMGGVHGALARHADGVLAALVPAQRATARTLLLRLVTPERTRTRRTADELGAPKVLDALVRARLVVARGEDPPSFELAHERLIDGWPTLAGWFAEAGESVAAHARLSTAVAEWKRLGWTGDALWTERQLDDVARISELTIGERTFVDASRRALRRRKLVRISIAIMVPALLGAFYIGGRVVAQRALDRHIATNIADSDRALAQAHTEVHAGEALRANAFEQFDAGNTAAGEQTWAAVRTHEHDAQTAYVAATRSLEAAFLLDTGRDDVRKRLAALTYERMQLAERERRPAERDELEGRLGLYDNGELTARLHAPAHIRTAITPDATVTLDGEPLVASVRPGSHVLAASAPGRATVQLPIVVAPGEQRDVHFELPEEAAVPAGFVYILAGRFAYGSRGDEPMRHFSNAVPMHELDTHAYLIARTETTYSEWIAFLDALPPAERIQRAPHIVNSATVQVGGAIDLARGSDGTWRLDITPASVAYHAGSGEAIVYPGRTMRANQDWLRMPISGISVDDARAYAAWLDRSGKVPHARLCTEVEWERAARGADGRTYPHGEDLAPDDANIDVTYGQKEDAFGPDEVGSHPASTSPLGLVDMSGNVWEITDAAGGGLVMRGGGYYTDAKSARLDNREVITPNFRHLHAGVRICADPI